MLERALGRATTLVRRAPSETQRRIDELEGSRARIVALADSERRAIERDLHDGVQQHLVALAVNVQLARQLADSDPAEARTLLEEIGRDVREALESARQIAQRIYPPLLVDRGLAEALAGAASAADIPTRLEATGLARYPDDVEAAVYFCCLEALRDAAGPGSSGVRASVRVWEERSELRFEVTDNGSSASRQTDRRPSRSIGDRVGALGGRLEFSSDPGRGTRVRGAIPLPR